MLIKKKWCEDFVKWIKFTIVQKQYFKNKACTVLKNEVKQLHKID